MVSFEQMIEQVPIRRGVTALIGGGGKTSLLLALGANLQKSGSVLLCTSTHIYPPQNVPLWETLDRPLPFGECAAVGTTGESGKLTAPRQPFSELIGLCDYVLCEADGSRGLPLKAHAAHEPVIPPESTAVLAVLGLDGVGQPIKKAAHRPALYAERLGVSEDTVVTPTLAAQMLNRYPGVTGVVLNKADTDARLRLARETAALLPMPAAITVLQPEPKIIELWRNGTCWLS